MPGNMISRRTFMHTTGAASLAGAVTGTQSAQAESLVRLPREVWVAAITIDGIHSETPEGSVDQVIRRLEQVMTAGPDIVCLPEWFNTARSKLKKPTERIAESVPGPSTNRLAEVARRHHCWIIAPLITAIDGKFLNSAVVINRQGDIVGRYDKMMLTIGEMEDGLVCGVRAPVFETDFGKIGIQTCFDINWTDGWEALRRQGAEIVFWPSGYPGGRQLMAKAATHEYYLVSAPWFSAARVIDITGDTIEQSGNWRSWVCAPINLERKRFHWDGGKIEKVQARYGRRVTTEWYHEENWWILESRDPELSIATIIKEFDLETSAVTREAAEAYKRRQGG